jgi:opacity protein-like surface antigen
MKKNYLHGLTFVFAIILIGSQVYSQGPYVNVNLGYGLKASSQNISFENEFFPEEIFFYNQTSGSNSETKEQINASFGKGFNAGATFGYMISEYIGAELGISYLFGGKTKATQSGSYNNVDKAASAKMLRFNPSLVITPGLDGINPYAKFGVLIGTGSVKVTGEGTYMGDVMNYEFKLKGGVAFGLTAGIGALYNLNDNMALFAELNMVNMSYAPKKGEVKELMVNGTDILATMDVADKEYEYVKELTTNNETNPLNTEPTELLKQRLPFGSFGINVGFRIGL